MDIVGHRKLFYALSGTVAAASTAALVAFGLPLGIDFTGGSLLELLYPLGRRPSVAEIEERISPFGLGQVRIQPVGEQGLILRTKPIGEQDHQAVLRALGAPAEGSDSGIVERRFNSVGPTIGAELRKRALAAIGLVLLLILLYVAWAFRRAGKPVPGASPPPRSWQYGLITIAALVHDILVPAGFFAVAGRLAGFEADTLFVTALLTVLGFSVHDTIVVFDRVRENLLKTGSGSEFPAIVNKSVNEIMARSLNTSLAIILALAAVLIFGGSSTRAFSLALIIGLVAGTYSSLFIASPLLVTWHRFQLRRAGR